MKCYLCSREATTCTPWGDFICNECFENITMENRRITNLDNKTRCIELKEAISDLIMIIEIEDKEPYPRFFSFLKVMRNNLCVCIQNNFESLDELIPLFQEDWGNCWQVHCGLGDWYIYREEYEERLKENKILRNLENKIEKLMKFKE